MYIKREIKFTPATHIRIWSKITKLRFWQKLATKNGGVWSGLVKMEITLEQNGHVWVVVQGFLNNYVKKNLFVLAALLSYGLFDHGGVATLQNYGIYQP
jgi:hypothetical protein